MAEEGSTLDRFHPAWRDVLSLLLLIACRLIFLLWALMCCLKATSNQAGVRMAPNSASLTATWDPAHGPKALTLRCISSLSMLPDTSEVRWAPHCVPFPHGCGHRTLSSFFIPAPSRACSNMGSAFQLSNPHPKRATFLPSIPRLSVSLRTPKKEQKEPVSLG